MKADEPPPSTPSLAAMSPDPTAKKRHDAVAEQDGAASAAGGQSASPPRFNADLEGCEDNAQIGTLHTANGDVYEGEVKDGKPHGRGTLRWANGAMYDGQWVGGTQHGRGAMKLPTGEIYEGEWKEGKLHGKGTLKDSTGRICEGEFKEGTSIAVGSSVRGEHRAKHGELTNRDATNQSPSGNVAGESALPNADSGNDDAAPKAVAGRGLLDGRKLRSQRSQKNRLETVKQTCEHCGVDDYHYKLRACSGCNLALYCSEACQKAASRSHRRICNISSQLPSRDADRLDLEYGEDKLVDLDAGLRYATKYMGSLKHLQIDITEMERGPQGDTLKLSAKQLRSLLRSKKGMLDFVSWLSVGKTDIPGITKNGHDTVWKELHGLKQLYLCLVQFDDVQCLQDIIGQQKNTLMGLYLPHPMIDWHKAKCRRAFAQAIRSCKHLVKLDLQGCPLMDSDLKIMLQDLPDLRVLHLERHREHSNEYTDNTCGLIARKCPGLQELDLRNHNQLSVRGVRKIFEGCPHLRSFLTTTRKLSSNDVLCLLDIAPQLFYLAVGDKDGFYGSDICDDKLVEIVKATGGRTVLHRTSDFELESGSASVKTREMYDCRMGALGKIWSRSNDPKTVNEWEELFDG